MCTNATNLVPESSGLFICEKCDYTSIRKSQYDRHLLTRKHQIATSVNQTQQNTTKKFECKCGKMFAIRSTLWRHKKKCNNINEKDVNEIDINEMDINDIDATKLTDKELIVLLLKQNSQLIEQNGEFMKNGTHNTNSHNTTTNSHNKAFNLNFFLNETCKDAMNIMDFVDSIKLQLSDLEKVGEIGYVEGISNIINENLKALDVTQRPVHCTDKKREVLYVKDQNKWEKENETKAKIRKAIKYIAHKNTKLIPVFRNVHPDCGKSISKYSDQFNKIVIEAMGGPGDNDTEKEDKIIRNISKHVMIDKAVP